MIHIIVSLKINLFSPWYCWKIAELALNNNHSPSHNVNHIWIKNILIVPVVSSINCAANRLFQSNIDTWCQLFLVYVRLYVHWCRCYMFRVRVMVFNATFNSISVVSVPTRFIRYMYYWNLQFLFYLINSTSWIIYVWLGGWLLFNANSAIFQQYHGENKLNVNETMMWIIYE
jgi:hypothetical protein